MKNEIRGLVVIITVSFLLLGSMTVYGEERHIPDYQVKAAFLFNFMKFIEWPEDVFSAPDAPIILGILGEDPFGSVLYSIKGKIVGGRKLLINKYKDVKDIRVCHVLFISHSEKDRLVSILKVLKNSKILLVGDVNRFAQKGGIINFVEANNKVGIEINVDAAGRAGLKINSRLLNMAKIVHDSSPKDGD